MARKRGETLTDEQKLAKKQAKAASERERYQAVRKAGFTPDQARSIQKTIAQQPELIKAISDAGTEIIDRMNWLGAILTGEPKKGRTSKEAPAVSTYKRNPTPQKKTRRTSESVKNNDAAFKRFIKKNPDLSVKELERQWREKGKAIGHAKAQGLARNVRKIEKNQVKHVRFNYISPEEAQEDFRKRYHVKKRYIYLVTFEVEVEGQPDTFEEYLHITSDDKITNMRDLRQEVIDAWADGQALGRKEKYKTKNLILDSIRVLYAVDMEKS